MSFLGAALSVSLVVLLVLSVGYIRLAVDLIYGFNGKMLAQTNYSLTYVDDLAQKLANTLYLDEKVIAFLNEEEEDPMTALQAIQRVRKHTLPMSYVDSVYLYNAGLNFALSTGTGEQQAGESFSDQDTIDYLQTVEDVRVGQPFFRIVHREGNSPLCSYVVFDTSAKSADRYNAIVINVSASALTNSMQVINRYQSGNSTEYMVFDENGEVLVSTIWLSDDQKLEMAQAVGNALEDSGGIVHASVTISGADYFLSCNNDNPNKLLIVSATPRQIVYRDVAETTLTALACVLGVLLVAGILIFLLSLRLYQPVKSITRLVNGHRPALADGAAGDEFEYLSTVFRSMEEQNREFARFKTETRDSARQNFMDSILGENNMLSEENLRKKSELLNLSQFLEQPLCMCLVKIDRYHEFHTENNKKERWALRYAIANIAQEIAEKHFPSEIFSRNSDKFIVLIQCGSSLDVASLQAAIEAMLRELQESVRLVHVTVSAAYSTVFSGAERLAGIYSNLEDMLKMKMQAGHECIINPYLADDMNTDSFPKPAQESYLVEQTSCGKWESAKDACGEILDELASYSNEEILMYMTHLGYTVCTAAQEKTPPIRRETAEAYRDFMARLEYCEVFDDVRAAAFRYLESVSSQAARAAQNPSFANGEAVARRVRDFVERNYQRKDLCLSMIADELNLTPNYVGHLFKQARQISVSKYILDLRMEKMGEYLRTTTYSSGEIIDRIGLERSNYVYTCFKRHFGMSLSEYKAKYGNRQDSPLN